MVLLLFFITLFIISGIHSSYIKLMFLLLKKAKVLGQFQSFPDSSFLHFLVYLILFAWPAAPNWVSLKCFSCLFLPKKTKKQIYFAATEMHPPVSQLISDAKKEGLFYGTHSSFWGYLPTFDPNKNMTCVKYISLKNL